MEVLDNFSLNKPYRFCIYLASIILVSSFLTEPPGINVSDLRSGCIWFIALGLVAWILEGFSYMVYLEDLDCDIEDAAAVAGSRFNLFKLIINIMCLFLGVMILASFS